MPTKKQRTQINLTKWNHVYDELLTHKTKQIEVEVQKTYPVKKNGITKYVKKMVTQTSTIPEYLYWVLNGGYASGKSAAVYRAILAAMAECSDLKALVFRKSGEDVRKSSWADILIAIKDLGLEDVYKSYGLKITYNTTNMTVTFPNGSFLQCMGLDDPLKIKSIPGIDIIAFEEATEFEQNDFDEARNRIRGTHIKYQRFYMMFNPVSEQNWIKGALYDHVYENYEDMKTTGVKYIHTTVEDNEYASISDKIKYRALTGNARRVQYLGEWGLAEGQVFDQVEHSDLSENTILNHLNSLGHNFTVNYGADWGFNPDPSVVLKVIRDSTDDTVYVLDEIYQSRMTMKTVANAIKDKGWTRDTIRSDTNMGWVDSLHEDYNLWNITKVKKPKVDKSIEELKSYRIVVLAEAPNTERELMNYAYTKNGSYPDKDNHSIDALRYALTDKGVKWEPWEISVDELFS